MARQTPPMPRLAIMARQASARTAMLAASVRLRPNRSAAMPLGTSHKRLTRWKNPSAKPIWASEKPRPASSTTQIT